MEEYILPPGAVTQRVLTIYGDRGWNEQDGEYSQSSAVRGHAGLNAQIHRLLRSNPEMTIQSVSISSTVYPDTPGVRMLRMFATVVYTGPALRISELNYDVDEPPEDKRNFDDDSAGYHTMVKVYL